jgi:hypothetical protein
MSPAKEQGNHTEIVNQIWFLHRSAADPEEHDIAILHPIFTTFDSQLARGA